MPEQSGIEIQRLRDRIKSQHARKAFDLFLSGFKENNGLTSRVGKHGFINDFRIEAEARNCFAFTVNQSWLLCYFSAPALTAGIFSGEEIQRLFPDAQQAGKEWKLRVHNRQEAAQVIDYVSGALHLN